VPCRADVDGWPSRPGRQTDVQTGGRAGSFLLVYFSFFFTSSPAAAAAAKEWRPTAGF